METKIKVLIISLIITLTLFLVAFISNDIRVYANALIISAFVILAPISYFSYLEYKRVKDYEVVFPNFLRDLIENLRAGVPLYQAIYFCSKYEYGPLTKEVKRMANKISWGIRLENVLDDFSRKVSLSKKLVIAIQMIKETYIAGGDVISILEHLAESLISIQETEKERKSLLNQQVFLMYALSVIFLVIVISLHKFLLPVFNVASAASEFGAVGIKNPCIKIWGLPEDVKEEEIPSLSLEKFLIDLSIDPAMGICDIYYFISSALFLNFTQASSYYIVVFFLMILSQSLFAGLVAGEVSAGSWRVGIRHSLVLVMINVGIFVMLVGFKIIS